MSTLSAVILAAGAGTRMKSQKSKVVHEVCFRPLIQWVYQTANKAGAEKIVTVVGHKAEQVTSCLGEDKLYALQAVSYTHLGLSVLIASYLQQKSSHQ